MAPLLPDLDACIVPSRTDDPEEAALSARQRLNIGLVSVFSWNIHRSDGRGFFHIHQMAYGQNDFAVRRANREFLAHCGCH